MLLLLGMEVIVLLRDLPMCFHLYTHARGISKAAQSLETSCCRQYNSGSPLQRPGCLQRRVLSNVLNVLWLANNSPRFVAASAAATAVTGC